MAFYIEEEEVWKCPKHPSKRRRNGVCPVCLKDRLVILCPDCANVRRPCSCAAADATSSSSSSDGNPNFRRSGSVGINFLRFGYARSFSGRTAAGKSKTPSFWPIILPSSKSRREPENKENGYRDEKIAEFTRLMMRSRSVTSGSGNCDKGGGWQFPGWMKIFQHSMPAKVVQERYPLCNV